MSVPARLGPRELLDVAHAIAEVLSDHAAALDRLELGEDWDEGAAGGGRAAGSDLAASLAAAVSRAECSPPGHTGPLLATLAEGAREAARGHSGVRLAAVLAGLAEAATNADALDGQRFAIGLEIAAEALAPAEAGPGTLPAVVAASSDGALAAVDQGAPLADVVIAAADEGLTELEAGPITNPVLVDRGVVDAAAAGMLLVLDVLAAVLTGESLPAPPADLPVQRPGSMRLEVRCRVEPHEGCGFESAAWLERTWRELGDVLRFDRSDDAWSVALATSLPGAAIEALCEVGRPRDLSVGPPSTGT